MIDNDNDNIDNYKMKNLVDISAMVTQSLNFFDIKDKIIEKMLEVVHPTKACVNLFYRNKDYDDMPGDEKIRLVGKVVGKVE